MQGDTWAVWDARRLADTYAPLFPKGFLTVCLELGSCLKNSSLPFRTHCTDQPLLPRRHPTNSSSPLKSKPGQGRVPALPILAPFFCSRVSASTASGHLDTALGGSGEKWVVPHPGAYGGHCDAIIFVSVPLGL